MSQFRLYNTTGKGYHKNETNEIGSKQIAIDGGEHLHSIVRIGAVKFQPDFSSLINETQTQMSN